MKPLSIQQAWVSPLYVVLLLPLTACMTPQPRIAPPPGLYDCPQMATMSDAKPAATIFYTTDGSSPNTSSPKYTNPVAFSSSGKVQAVALAAGMKLSKITSVDYSCAPRVTTIAFAAQMQQLFGLTVPPKPVHFADLSPTDENYAAAQSIAPFLNRQVLCHGCQLSTNFVPNQALQRGSSGVFFVSLLLAQKKIQLLSPKEADAVLTSVPDANMLPGLAARRYLATALKNSLLPLHKGNTLDGLSPLSQTEMTAVLKTIQNNFNLPPTRLQ